TRVDVENITGQSVALVITFEHHMRNFQLAKPVAGTYPNIVVFVLQYRGNVIIRQSAFFRINRKHLVSGRGGVKRQSAISATDPELSVSAFIDAVDIIVGQVILDRKPAND